MAKCKSCNAEIDYVRSKGGRLIPVNNGYVTVVTDSGHVIKGRVSHFATCPDANKFRTGRVQV
ncbi:MAG: hypothetical protein WC364_04785 [Eubacteriales bacterium]|jgi:hypothetical protein